MILLNAMYVLSVNGLLVVKGHVGGYNDPGPVEAIGSQEPTQEYHKDRAMSAIQVL